MNEFHKILLVMDNAASKEIARTFVLFEEWGGDRKTTVTNCRFSCVVQICVEQMVRIKQGKCRSIKHSKDLLKDAIARMQQARVI